MIQSVNTIRLQLLKMWLRHLGFNLIADTIHREEHQPTLRTYARLIMGNISDAHSILKTTEQFMRLELL